MCIQCHEILESLYTKASKQVYHFVHCFRSTLASLLSPLVCLFSNVAYYRCLKVVGLSNRLYNSADVKGLSYGL